MALALAACTGGERALTTGEIRELTGLSAPVETAAQQQARQEDIFARADSLILSTMRVEVVGPDVTFARRWLPACSGPSCDLLDPVTGRTGPSSLATFEIVQGDAEVIGSVHGITLMSETTHHMDLETISFGAWMEHGSFGLFEDRLMGEEIESVYSYALALGSLTNRPLAGSATRHHGGNAHSRGHSGRLGTAALNYDMNAGGLDVFRHPEHQPRDGARRRSGDLLRPRSGAGRDLRQGRVRRAHPGRLPRCRHAEAAGIFEQSDLTGAFGARRQ